MQKVIFIGAGAIATALGNILARNKKFEVELITIENQVAESINRDHLNYKYFPSIPLEQSLRASVEFERLSQKAFVFIAIPSVAIYDFFKQKKIHPESILVNLAKGFGKGSQTIVDCLGEILPNQVVALKGPSFAREIINNQPTSFTLGSRIPDHLEAIRELFAGTSLHLDYSDDVAGVEYLGILKNIYAIAIGVVDAQYDSPNLKFMIFTRALNEMKFLLKTFGGKDDTLFKYCGIGDFGLTALNDLSRNRTLGLLLGKGFFTEHISDKVVLEGRIAVNIFHQELADRKISHAYYPIMHELFKVFQSNYDISGFVNQLISTEVR